MGNLESSIDLKMFSDCGRKMECLEKAHTERSRSYKFHIESLLV